MRTSSTGSRRFLAFGLGCGVLAAAGAIWHTGTTSSATPPEPQRAALALGAAGCPAQDDGCVPLTGGVTPNGRVGLGYRIAGASGVVVLGRWDCRSTSTPAVLDPATGRVWVFDSWPRSGSQASARLVAIDPGGSTLRVIPQVRTYCDLIEIEGGGRPPLLANPTSPLGHPGQ